MRYPFTDDEVGTNAYLDALLRFQNFCEDREQSFRLEMTRLINRRMKLPEEVPAAPPAPEPAPAPKSDPRRTIQEIREAVDVMRPRPAPAPPKPAVETPPRKHSKRGNYVRSPELREHLAAGMRRLWEERRKAQQPPQI